MKLNIGFSKLIALYPISDISLKILFPSTTHKYLLKIIWEEKLRKVSNKPLNIMKHIIYIYFFSDYWQKLIKLKEKVMNY